MQSGAKLEEIKRGITWRLETKEEGMGTRLSALSMARRAAAAAKCNHVKRGDVDISCMRCSRV